MDDRSAREEIRSLLSQGLQTEVLPRADGPERVQEIVGRLEAAADLKSKLSIAGFTLTTFHHQGIDQPCESCMYYLVHRRFCELPSLQLPVEPEWSCRLWRL